MDNETFDLANFDTKTDLDQFGATGSKESLVHIRIQQRSGKKTITSVEGIDPKFCLETLLKVWKSKFSCNGSVTDHPTYGQVIQLQGDQRDNIESFLVDYKIVDKKSVKKHGF
ncbi:putative RNA-binding protein eif1AD [Cichlidogyrus casuarinus]|uniref:RNA-binding protein eif1AD n=1 Tax=Cichlidogyrus casuarinus TaxID=1844966 RepID=A0ABD2QKT5_9PLAT